MHFSTIITLWVLWQLIAWRCARAPGDVSAVFSSKYIETWVPIAWFLSLARWGHPCIDDVLLRGRRRPGHEMIVLWAYGPTCQRPELTSPSLSFYISKHWYCKGISRLVFWLGWNLWPWNLGRIHWSRRSVTIIFVQIFWVCFPYDFITCSWWLWHKSFSIFMAWTSSRKFQSWARSPWKVWGK